MKGPGLEVVSGGEVTGKIKVSLTRLDVQLLPPPSSHPGAGDACLPPGPGRPPLIGELYDPFQGSGLGREDRAAFIFLPFFKVYLF